MPPKIDPRRDEFLIGEFKLVRQEMDEAIRESRTNEKYALVSAAAIWSWLASLEEPQAVIKQIAIWLPLLVIVFFLIRAVGLTKHIDAIGRFLATVEKSFGIPKELGFEQSLETASSVKRVSVYIFWIGLVIAAIVIPLLNQ